ncbi:MAG: DUF1003 domain-containing protein [Candidatus Kaiserbacteria bacterium]|nr:MAG: DUF1003 domain-containing protein [Candidatus Kaiserbacteria bacterium]
MNGKSWHDWYVEERSAGERIADRITNFVGSWPFIYLHIVWFGVWLLLPVEPFPFGLLTAVVSLEAILLSTFIMMSQNRQAERDRRQAKADYETNLAAKVEIEDLQQRLVRIENDKLDRIVKILAEK